MKRKRKYLHKILPFRCVKLNVPRKNLIKLFYSERSLTTKQTVKLRTKLEEIESVQNKLNHVCSIVEKILTRRGFSG